MPDFLVIGGHSDFLNRKFSIANGTLAHLSFEFKVPVRKVVYPQAVGSVVTS